MITDVTTVGGRGRRHGAVLCLMSLLAILLGAGCLFVGSVDVPVRDVLGALTGGDVGREAWRVIVLQTRVPMVVTAAVAGAALSVAGLLLQTCFDNPLAGPSILGVSTGASLGVALVMLGFGGAFAAGWGQYVSCLAGALAGAAAVLAVLLVFSRFVRSTAMLLIVGILVGYFASSAIALLNYFSTQEGVHSYIIWGLGTFSGVSGDRAAIFACLTVPVVLLSMLLIKPLNALLLGARYAESIGVDIRAMRYRLLIVSGVLTASATAFCGPIGFLGLIVPHVARMSLRSSNHAVLLPCAAIAGSAMALLCAFISVLPISAGVMPINAITPIIGVPIVIYVILNRKKLMYFD